MAAAQSGGVTRLRSSIAATMRASRATAWYFRIDVPGMVKIASPSADSKSSGNSTASGAIAGRVTASSSAMQVSRMAMPLRLSAISSRSTSADDIGTSPFSASSSAMRQKPPLPFSRDMSSSCAKIAATPRSVRSAIARTANPLSARPRSPVSSTRMPARSDAAMSIPPLRREGATEAGIRIQGTHRPASCCTTSSQRSRTGPAPLCNRTPPRDEPPTASSLAISNASAQRAEICASGGNRSGISHRLVDHFVNSPRNPGR